MKIISLNVRGFGGDVRWKYMKELISKEKPGLVCLQETKLISVSAFKCFGFWGSNDVSWIHKGIDNEGGGILTLWDKKVFNCTKSVDGKGYVLIEGVYNCISSGKDVKVVIMNIYTPCPNKEKMLLWREIQDVLASVNSSIKCVIGDFNSVRIASERKGIGSGVVNNSDIARFREFLERCELKGIPAVGSKYTWYRPNGTARSRLDRVLVFDEWMMQWSRVKQYILSRQVSDYCAIVVKSSIVDWGPKPFRTFDVWQNSEGFDDVLRNAWEASTSHGNSLEGLKDKLKGVKIEIKHWNKEVVSSAKSRKQQLLVEIEDLDRQDDEGILSEEMRVKRVDLLSQLRSLEEKDIAMLKQKARVEWLKSGDTNFKFYHSSLRWRIAKNNIVGLRINGARCEEVPTVKGQVKEYFESRFGVSLLSLVNLDGVGFKRISAVDNDLLCDNITEVEVLEAVSQCGSSKCPGPDGFNFAFVKKYWEVIETDIV